MSHRKNALAYGRVAGAYDAFLTLTGFKRGIESFLDRQRFELPARPRILDAGCGTGLLAVYLARRFPAARIYATDIDTAMLAELERVARREGISHQQLVVAQSDLRVPEQLRDTRTGQSVALADGYFDAVVVSGALEHVPLAESVRRLARLLKPGGTFLNIGLRRSPAGAILGMMYRCRPYRLAEVRHACGAAGLTDIRVVRLKAEDFPANLSRIAITAQKGYE